MKKTILLFSILSFINIQAQIEAYYQQQVEYKMDIEVDAKNYQYTGKQTITYTNNSPDTLKTFYFHLYWNAFQPGSMMDQRLEQLGKDADRRMITTEGLSRINTLNSKEIGYQKVNSLKQNNNSVTYTVKGTVLKVNLAKPILPKSTTTFTMDWEAQVPVMIRRAGRNNNEGIEFSMAQWYPKVAAYDYEGWHTFDYIAREFHGVFGNFDVTINIDKEYVIGASGVLQNPKQVKGYDAGAKQVIKNNKTQWHFKAENIHDFAWAADPDYSVETSQVPNGPLLYFVYQKTEKTSSLWEEAKPIMVKFFQILNRDIGAYPYSNYSIIQAGDGGMEYGMCTLILGESASLDGLVKLMFHEAAHSWFQQIIATNESMRAWMDEGFTSYVENKAYAEIFPEKVERYPNAHIGAVDTYTNFARLGNEEVMGILADHFNTNNGYSIAAYIKGEMFLVQLGYIVGEQNLSKIIKEYYTTWKFKHPTDRDFIHIAQKVSQMNLKWYWNYMTYTTRQIDYSIKNVEAKDSITSVTIENSGTFPMPVDIYVIFNDGKREVFTIPLNMMQNTKKQEFNISQTVLPYWEWTKKEYNFIVPASIGTIKNIIIDATFRIGDVDFDNNIYNVK